MIDEIFDLMKDYEKAGTFGPIKIILFSDSSGYYYFESVDVKIEFDNLIDAHNQWFKIFSYKD